MYILLNVCFLLITQKLALHESNISRYNAEFAEISTIGSGQFGSVHKCVNRLGEYMHLFLTKTKEVIHNYTLVAITQHFFH